MLTASFSAKEKDGLVAGENAAQEERLCPMKMAVVVNAVRGVMV